MHRLRLERSAVSVVFSLVFPVRTSPGRFVHCFKGYSLQSLLVVWCCLVSSVRPSPSAEYLLPSINPANSQLSHRCTSWVMMGRHLHSLCSSIWKRPTHWNDAAQVEAGHGTV
jgi:hypothetical protein